MFHTITFECSHPVSETQTGEICVLTPAAFGNYADPKPAAPLNYARWHVRRLSLDPMTSTVGDCSIVYLAKEGHEADITTNPGSWTPTLQDGSTASMGSHSQIVISYDDSGFVSVHTHAAWGMQGDLKRPVLLDSITATDYAISFTPGRSWACPESDCWVGLSVCGLFTDYAEIVTSMSSIGVVDAESLAIDACASFRRRLQSSSQPPRRSSKLHASLVADALPSDSDGSRSAHIVECTFIATICEDHFLENQHFRFGTCARDGNTSSSFSPGTLHLVNLHGGSYHRGQRLVLSVRYATSQDLHDHSHARRQLQTHPQPELHEPMWLTSGHGLFVERVLHNGVNESETRLSSSGRALSHDGHTSRSLLTICMQYPLSTATCTASLDAFTAGVDQTHTTASYGRLDPPWDATPSRFYIVMMPELNNTMRSRGCEYWSTTGCEYWTSLVDLANYPNNTNLTLETVAELHGL